MNVRDVIEGHANELTNSNNSLMEKRMEICKQCPLYKVTNLGPVCNNRLYMNPDGKTSTYPLEGYRKGCGCRLNAKTRVTRATCTHGRW